MDNLLVFKLEGFHTLANKGSLSNSDRERLFEFIDAVSEDYNDIDQINKEVFDFLTQHQNMPWTGELARGITSKIRFGIELLRYSRGR